MERAAYDRTGKLDLGSTYNQLDPVAYFSTLAQLDYRIPAAARPLFSSLIAGRRRATGRHEVKIVDLGCSYGVNAALLKHGLSMDELYQLYAASDATARAELIERDRRLYAETSDDALTVVGVDLARNAVDYAVRVGNLDAGIATDLERRDPTAEDRALLAGSDLILSTGCFGYVTETSLERLLEATMESRPWMAHFVLRMFGFEEAEEMLAAHGYVTEKAEGIYRQRRFASRQERDRVLENLAARGVDPAGAEAAGWYYAELFVARPKADAARMPLDRLLAAPATEAAA